MSNRPSPPRSPAANPPPSGRAPQGGPARARPISQGHGIDSSPPGASRTTQNPGAGKRKTTAVVEAAPVNGAVDEEQFEQGEQGKNRPQRRQRLRTETRDELLQRLTNPLVNLDEAAILLRVCRATVRRYADSGLLPCERTPGGQRRFRLRAIIKFYKEFKE